MSASGPTPTVSVVIPVFNGASFLADAVACVRTQSRRPDQIIVVDDGSTDGTAQVAQTLGPDIEFLAQENRGPAAARNRGLQLVRSDFVCFLDVDDLWPADKLAGQLDVLVKEPATGIVLGQTLALEEPGVEKMLRQFAPDGTSPPHLFFIGAALFRRSVFEQIGNFDPERRYGEDWDWFIRAREALVPFHLLPKPGLIKRCHTHNMTRGKSFTDMSLAGVLRASLRRRRKASGVAEPLRELHP